MCVCVCVCVCSACVCVCVCEREWCICACVCVCERVVHVCTRVCACVCMSGACVFYVVKKDKQTAQVPPRQPQRHSHVAQFLGLMPETGALCFRTHQLGDGQGSWRRHD